MAMGIPIAADIALALSTTPTANLVQNTYDYIGAGKLKLFAKGSAAATPVLVDLFVNGIQIARRLAIPFSGTAGTLDTSANLVTDVNTLGGRVELVIVAESGTPTVDFILTFEGVPLIGTAISRLLGRR